MKELINELHKSKLLGALFHTLDYCLQKELMDCESVLDLGCGPSSPLQYCLNVKRSVGVEAFEPYLAAAQKRRTHSEFLAQKIEDLDFPAGSFDAIILIEVIEHLPEGAALAIIQKAEKWAKKKVLISSPNGFVEQKAVDGNPLQQHLSGWDLAKMQKMGYRCHGLAGLKCLRQEVQNDSMGEDLLTSIRFRPKVFWFGIATLSQIITYFIPSLAFELFSVKEKHESYS